MLFYIDQQNVVMQFTEYNSAEYHARPLHRAHEYGVDHICRKRRRVDQ